MKEQAFFRVASFRRIAKEGGKGMHLREGAAVTVLSCPFFRSTEGETRKERDTEGETRKHRLSAARISSADGGLSLPSSRRYGRGSTEGDEKRCVGETYWKSCLLLGRRRQVVCGGTIGLLKKLEGGENRGYISGLRSEND